MNARTLLRYAVAETRRSRGTLAFCVASIAIGVLSLSAVRGVVFGIEDSMAGQARSILGADLELSANQPLDGGAAAELTADLREVGAEVAEIVSLRTMVSPVDASADAGPGTRLVRLRAVRGPYPLYGRIDTEPPGLWSGLGDGPRLVVEPSLYRDLDIEPGDRVRIGELEVTVAGAFDSTPGSPAASFGLAPTAYLHARFLDDTGLVKTGSRIDYERLFRVPEEFDARAWKREHWDRALADNVTIRTAREAASNVQRFLGRLSHFLTVVGLVTLLLGALGIGSAMTVFIRGKLDNAAVLRCLGATSRQVFAIYAGLAALVGAAGSLLGAALGAAVPPLVGRAAGALGGDMLPAELDLGVSVEALAHGLVAGVTATLAFAVFPIHRIGRVSPLRVMRRAVDPPRRRARDWVLAALAVAGLFAFVLALSVVETGSTRVAAFFTGTIAVSVLLLSGISRLVAVLARRIAPVLPRYTLRQGVANLHRPGNQTTSALTAVGLGVLLVATIGIVEASIQRTIAIEDRDELPNVFAIDIQPGQIEGVRDILGADHVRDVHVAPMVAARIAAVDGRSVDRSSVARDARERTWEDRMRTREYFISYRDHLVESETVTSGELWDGRPARQEASIDRELADNLGIELGDTLTLDVQGIPIDAVVTSTREIRWQAMRPNAMILLSPGPIEQAPRMYVASFRVPDEDRRYAIQDEIVDRYPNVSAVDITDAAATVRMLLGRISAVLELLAVLTVVAGAVIVGGAIAAGRFARLRETMLLKVLGASRGQLRAILATEYVCLASLGGGCGWLLAEAVNRPALRLFFDTSAAVPYPLIAAVVGGVVALNTAIGFAVSRGVAEGRPLDILREE